jgi:hypothetical protein
MHLGRFVITSCLLAAFAAGAAVVYKWTDADGVVHFSDQPVPGAEKIITASGATNGISGPVRAPAPASGPAPAPGRLAFTEFAIASPAPEQVFFGDEVIPVRLAISPGLQPEQQIAWNLNGAPLTDQGGASAFALSGLSRGAYQITATVTDSGTGNAKTTDAVTFYVRQPSALAPLDPQRKK